MRASTYVCTGDAAWISWSMLQSTDPGKFHIEF
jgi:hypothetical protein